MGDESGLRSDDVRRTRLCAQRATVPMLRVNACREGLSVISTVTPKASALEGFRSPDAKILIGFLERL